MESAIKITDLKKHYRSGIRGLRIAAVDGISFNVNKGEILGLLGSNGAGKSTTIKILIGLLKQSAGDVKIFGQTPNREIRAKIGYLPESPYFYKFLTGFELVNYYAKLCGMTSKDARIATEKALEIVGLSDAANRRIGLYSKGMTQRAGLAQAIVHNPQLLILDEPASGLDPIGAEDLSQIILRLRDEGKTILLSSHLMSEVEKLCDRIVVISKGKVVAIGQTSELLTLKDEYNISLKTSDNNIPNKIADFATSVGANDVSVEYGKITLEEYFRKISKK